MAKEQPNYYSIIPAFVRYDKDLNPNEKLMYGEITALSNKSGFCWSGNQYFADLYGVTKRTVRRWLENLEEKEYIKRENITDDKGKVVKRKIYIVARTKMSAPSGQKCPHPEDKNVRYNITSNNITSNNKDNKDIVEKNSTSSESSEIPYKEIVDYLNNRLGTRYRHTTKKTRRMIRARWKEGFRLLDFKTVIEKKAMEWLGDKKMEKYLRPQTLFGTKFEGYLNQISVNNEGNNSGLKQLKELWAEAELEELEGSEGDYIL